MPRTWFRPLTYSCLTLAVVVAAILWFYYAPIAYQTTAIVFSVVIVVLPCCLSFASRQSVSPKQGAREMIIWSLVGGVCAYFAGWLVIRTGYRAPIDRGTVMAGLMFLALLYGSRRSRALYPAALLGQIAGFVWGVQFPPYQRSTGGNRWLVLFAITWRCTAMTIAAIVVGYWIRKKLAASLLKSRAESRPPGRFRHLRSVHSLSALLFLAVVAGCVLPTVRRRMMIRDLGVPVQHDRSRATTGLPHWLGRAFSRCYVCTPFRIESGRVDDAQMRVIGRLTTLEELDVHGSEVTDAGLAYLRGLVRLRQLNVGSTKISDAGLEHISHLTRLETLYLNDTKISDAGLEYVSRLTRLETLDLCGTEISDRGMDHLAKLTTLRRIRLRRTRISQRALLALQKLPRLSHVYVDRSIEPHAIEELRRAMPHHVRIGY